MEKEKSPTFVEYLTIIVKRRLFILKVIASGFVISLLISICLRNQYTAATTILPPNPQQDMMYGFVNPIVASSMGGNLGLTSLLAGGSRPSDLFAAILNSGKIKGAIINKYNLKKVFRSRTVTDAVKQLEEITKIDVTPEGMITVNVTWFNKQLAADIANSYIEELDKFNNQTAMTVGKRYRVFIEERLKTVEDSLAQVETALKNFQEENKTIALDAEIQSVIETIAKLKSEIILREVQKGALGSASSSNPYAQSIEQELRELKRQLSKIEFGGRDTTKKEFGAGFSVSLSELPVVALEYARLLRDVKVQEAIYELMTQQYEQAKLMEVKDTPTVQVLDRAGPPEKKSAPKRTRIVILVSFFCFILGVIGAFVLESFEIAKSYPEKYGKWVDIHKKLENDFRTIKAAIVKIIRRKEKNQNKLQKTGTKQ